jgi:hypothetical protein
MRVLNPTFTVRRFRNTETPKNDTRRRENAALSLSEIKSELTDGVVRRGPAACFFVVSPDWQPWLRQELLDETGGEEFGGDPLHGGALQSPRQYQAAIVAAWGGAQQKPLRQTAAGCEPDGRLTQRKWLEGESHRFIVPPFG